MSERQTDRQTAVAFSFSFSFVVARCVAGVATSQHAKPDFGTNTKNTTHTTTHLKNLPVWPVIGFAMDL